HGRPQALHPFPTRRSSDLSSAHHEETMFSDSRPRASWSRLAACFARSAGGWNVGRTATMISSRSVTAASAEAVDHASRDGASIRSEEHTSELQSLAYLVCR